MKITTLTQKELNVVKDIQRQTGEGMYELRVFLARIWKRIQRPTDYGQRFRRSVLLGELPGISSIEKNVQNHRIYLIDRSA